MYAKDIATNAQPGWAAHKSTALLFCLQLQHFFLEEYSNHYILRQTARTYWKQMQLLIELVI